MGLQYFKQVAAIKNLLAVCEEHADAEYSGIGAWFPSSDYSGIVLKRN